MIVDVAFQPGRVTGNKLGAELGKQEYGLKKAYDYKWNASHSPLV